MSPLEGDNIRAEEGGATVGTSRLGAWLRGGRFTPEAIRCPSCGAMLAEQFGATVLVEQQGRALVDPAIAECPRCGLFSN